MNTETEQIPSERFAIIDCGSNTFNLLIADRAGDGKWQTLFQNKLAVKLGAGGFQTNEIITSRFYRGLDALLAHQQNILNFSCNSVYAFATSAIRDAKNGEIFVQRVKRLFDMEIETISGEREAELIYKGIIQTISLDATPALIMDIGGGSTEFIVANHSGILWKQSYQLGVSRLHDELQPADRMSHENTLGLRKKIDAELQPLKEALKQHAPKMLIGSSGSFDTLLDLYIHGTKQKDHEMGLSNEIPLHAFPGIHAWLMGSTFQERLKHAAIPSIRAEYMPLASYLVHYVLQLASFNKLYHSAYSLKEGVMGEMMRKD